MRCMRQNASHQMSPLADEKACEMVIDEQFVIRFVAKDYEVGRWQTPG